MQIKRQNTNDTMVKLSIEVNQAEISAVKDQVLRQLGAQVKVAGFRAGKAPQHLIEKQIDPSTLQTEFLQRCVNDTYVSAAQEQKLRPTKQPEISITKFVPFTTLEYAADVEVVGEITLPDYKKIKKAMPKASVEAKEITDVLKNLQQRGATKEEVSRASKMNDQVTFDFSGTDAKTHEPIEGASGKDYPLVIGSKTFIPGFEDELVGLKPDSDKTFDITFPADYSVANLQKRKVTFIVHVSKVEKLTEAKLDDAFASSIGPFKTMADLKADIKIQLLSEKTQQEKNKFQNELVQLIAEKATLAIPDSLVEAEIDAIEEEERRNLVYRGTTWEEHLEQEKLSAADHREKNRDSASLRVKAGLLLSEIAAKENIEVSREELERQLELMKGRYENDAAMQRELDKPDSRRDIANRLITEKTLDTLTVYATKP